MALADVLADLGLAAEASAAHVLVVDVPGQEDSLLAALPQELLACFDLLILRGCRDALPPGGAPVAQALDQLQQRSFDVLASGGRFVEIGKRGIKDHAWVDAQQRNWRYFIVDWGETAASEPALVGGMLARLVDEAARGLLPPLPRHTFAIDEATHAFRFMAQARHHGKIVLRHGVEAPVAIRRDGSYLVTGGLSGLGPVVARWLAARGAGRVVLVSRRGPTPDLTPVLEELRGHGTEVVADAEDIHACVSFFR